MRKKIQGVSIPSGLLFFIVISISECFSASLPYYIPEIKTATEFAHIVYIDPSSERQGDGTISMPLNSLRGLIPEPKTAYVIKRGTTLDEPVALKWNNNLLGAYGQGPRPVLTQGFFILANTNEFTLRDMDIRKPGNGGYDKVLSFSNRPSPANVTIAYCRIIGIDHGQGYPFYAIEHGAENLIFFNNEVAYCRNNGWWLNANDVKIIRNWFHNINKEGEHSPHSTGDIIQSVYFLNNAYIAGNLMDKSNSMWKYTLMLNVQHTSTGIIVEYNTFYAPRQGAGGAAVRWTPGTNATFRRNLVRSIDNQGRALVGPFETWQPIASQPEPFGIRDNHIITETAPRAVAYDRATLSNCNLVFSSNEEYEQYLLANPAIGLYGSDIEPCGFP